MGKYVTKVEILKRATELIGIPLGEIDKTGKLATGKGGVGTTIEEHWFGIKTNSFSEPDFKEAGVELKVTPYIKSKKGVRAKERLVCNIIDYMEEFKRVFKTSSFYLKCNTMLIMLYEHLFNIAKTNYVVDKTFLYSFSEEDLLIIEQDWEIIINKIIAGKAHEISERDTSYLSACTKGKDSASLRVQPFSEIRAKQRAFSLKSSYMTYVLNEYIYGAKKSKHIIEDFTLLEKNSLEQVILNKFVPYKNKKVSEMKSTLGIHFHSKNINNLLCNAILKNDNPEQTVEFQKANVKIKTIALETDENNIRENMSFPAFSFKKLANEEWEDSQEYHLFVEQKYLFIVFKKSKDDNPENTVFLNAFFWQLPEEDIEEVKTVWEKTQIIIQNGIALNYNGNQVNNNLPKSVDSTIAHIRPHAAKSAYKTTDFSFGNIHSDADELPDGRWMTKQCFWFNRNYILNQIKKNIKE